MASFARDDAGDDPASGDDPQRRDLAEVLGNLGVFSTHPEDLIAPCASGFRRVPISQGTDYYVSLQGG